MAERVSSPRPDGLTKIAIGLPPKAPTKEESLWAYELGDHLYRLDNTPWYAMGCSLGDVVECEDRPGQLPRLVKVVQPSGNRTVRVFVPEGPSRAEVKEGVFALLQSKGCAFEAYGAEKGLIAVTIPPTADGDSLFEQLDALESAGRAYWEGGNF